MRVWHIIAIMNINAITAGAWRAFAKGTAVNDQLLHTITKRRRHIFAGGMPGGFHFRRATTLGARRLGGLGINDIKHK